MQKYIRNTSVYILPSKFEPWGVTVQEFAVSGFPKIISDAVGAKEKYVRNNGFIFRAGDKDALQVEMKKFMEMSRKDIVLMAEESHNVGMSMTNEMWAKTARSFNRNS